MSSIEPIVPRSAYIPLLRAAYAGGSEMDETQLPVSLTQLVLDLTGYILPDDVFDRVMQNCSDVKWRSLDDDHWTWTVQVI